MAYESNGDDDFGGENVNGDVDPDQGWNGPTLAPPPSFSDYISFQEQGTLAETDYDVPPSVAGLQYPDIDQWLSSDDPFFGDLGLNWDASDIKEPQIPPTYDRTHLDNDATSDRQLIALDKQVSGSSSTLGPLSNTSGGNLSHHSEQAMIHDHESSRSWTRHSVEQAAIEEAETSKITAHQQLVPVARRNILPSGYAVFASKPTRKRNNSDSEAGYDHGPAKQRRTRSGAVCIRCKIYREKVCIHTYGERS